MFFQQFSGLHAAFLSATLVLGAPMGIQNGIASRASLFLVRANRVPGELEMFDGTCARHVLLAALAGPSTDVFGLRIRGERVASGRGEGGNHRKQDYPEDPGTCDHQRVSLDIFGGL